MASYYIPDIKGFQYEFKSTAGLVGRDFAKRGIRFQRLARGQAGAKTGDLRARMTWNVGADVRGVVLTVGSSSKIARIHHDGTRPHVIRPKQVGGALRFSSGGRIVYARRVVHPGTKPNRYLTDNLPRVVLT